jgi:hypothetical protein
MRKQGMSRLILLAIMGSLIAGSGALGALLFIHGNGPAAGNDVPVSNGASAIGRTLPTMTHQVYTSLEPPSSSQSHQSSTSSYTGQTSSSGNNPPPTQSGSHDDDNHKQSHPTSDSQPKSHNWDPKHDNKVHSHGNPKNGGDHHGKDKSHGSDPDSSKVNHGHAKDKQDKK